MMKTEKTEKSAYVMTAAEAEELWWASANGGGARRSVQAYHEAGGKVFLGWRVRSGMTMLIDREGYELVLAIADVPREPEGDVVELDMSFDGDIVVMGSDYVYMPESRPQLDDLTRAEMEGHLLGRFDLHRRDIDFYVAPPM